MNPAFRIWVWAIGLCAGVSLICSFAAASILLVWLFVASASVVSLVCFHLLFELLRLLQISRRAFWINTIIGIPAIVALNAWCFLLVFTGATENVWTLFRDFFPVTLIPIAGALVGTGVSRKQVNAFCTHEPQAYYPDACI